MNIIEYFKFLTDLEPTDNQKKLLLGATDINLRKILISAGFQSGKSLCTAVIVMWWTFEYEKPLGIILISAQEQVVYKHIRDMFGRHPELLERLGARSKLAADLIPIHGFELEKGSIVYIRGATEKQIRGIPADIVVMDEACLIKNEVILNTIGRLTGEIAKFILLSTPDVATSLFVKWATDKDSGFKVFTWEATIKECPWHNIEQEQLKKKEYTKQQYASLVLGRAPTREERAFFPSKQVDNCLLDVEPFKEGGEKARTEIGIDFGFSPSSTVLIVTERIGTMRRKILFWKVWNKKTVEQFGPEILDIINKFKPYLSKGDSKPEEYMEWFNRHGKKVKGISMNLGHKEQALGQLQRMIRQGGLIIPVQFIEIALALKAYRYVKATDAKSKGSDIVEALALSIYESESLGEESHREFHIFKHDSW